MLRASIVLFAAAALTACGAGRRELKPGSYRAVIEVPGGELPFGLDVGKVSERFVLILVNGEERQRIENVQVGEGTLRAVLPGNSATLEARITRQGLEGELTLALAGGRAMPLPFRAEFGATHRFIAEPRTDNADVQARWSVTLTAADGAATPAVAVFTQRFDTVTGRIDTRDLEGPLLTGQVNDDELYLSRFDGRTAMLLHAKIGAGGELDGEFWSAVHGAARFQAVRIPNAVL